MFSDFGKAFLAIQIDGDKVLQHRERFVCQIRFRFNGHEANPFQVVLAVDSHEKSNACAKVSERRLCGQNRVERDS
jgi:hypothetical protein